MGGLSTVAGANRKSSTDIAAASLDNRFKDDKKSYEMRNLGPGAYYANSTFDVST